MSDDHLWLCACGRAWDALPDGWIIGHRQLLEDDGSVTSFCRCNRELAHTSPGAVGQPVADSLVERLFATIGLRTLCASPAGDVGAATLKGSARTSRCSRSATIA